MSRLPTTCLLACLLALLSAACVDGYPPQHQAPLTPQEMTRDERLRVLNGIGAQGAGGAELGLDMPDRCTLRVRMLPPAPPSSRLLTLKGVYLDMDFDEEREVFDIGTQPDKERKTPRTPLLQAAAWTDASFAFKILRHLQYDCLQQQALAG